MCMKVANCMVHCPLARDYIKSFCNLLTSTQYTLCMLACNAGVFGERGCEYDQASAILDSNSEEAWRETKMRPREWELG